MISAIVAGLLFGLSAGLAPGPLLALVVRQSLSYGRREGLRAALAPLVTDLPILIVAILLVNRTVDLDGFFVPLSFAGAGYLLVLAYETARAPLPTAETAIKAPRSLMAGALANGLSPHPYLFWLTLGAPMTINAYREAGLPAAAVFVSVFYALLIGSKAVLAALIGGSRHQLSPRLYRAVMSALAVALGTLAVALATDAWGRLEGVL